MASIARRWLALALLLPPAAARAHSRLLASAPADGETLAGPPAGITLRFNEPAQLTALRLFAADGAEWPVTLRRVTAPEHRATPGRALTPGAWRLVWRAISADGHEIGGTIRFRVEAA